VYAHFIKLFIREPTSTINLLCISVYEFIKRQNRKNEYEELSVVFRLSIIPHASLVYYSAAALLAMQSAVIPTAIPFVRLSVCLSHAGTLSRRMKIESRGLHCEVAKHSSLLTLTMVAGDVLFHLKFALKMTHPLCKR